ncbi:hypothetical protein NFI96_018933 [Prochilodus magdalenae]|nr:hypothetical protein NFI96_018933 [Prochilodus magdalenae]
MPGIGDTCLNAALFHTEIAKCVTLSAPGPHAFLLVIPLGRYTEGESKAAQQMLRVFGETALQHHTLVLFTHGDELEENGVGIEVFLGHDETPEGLKVLIQTCRGRYHVLNNKDLKNRQQVKMLIKKVEMMMEENGGQFYTSAMFQQAEKAIQVEKERLMRERGEGEGKEEKRMGIRHQSVRLKVSRICKNAALSPKVLDQVKRLVAAGTAGMAAGTVFGAAAPLGLAAGVSMVGNSAGLVGVSVAGSGVGKALCAIVAAATSKTAIALGAATGGLLGGSMGALAGAEMAGPEEAALEAMGQVGTVGATVVGVATGLGGVLGAGMVIGPVLECGAALTGAESAAGGVVSTANTCSTALTASQAVPTGDLVAGAVQTLGGASCSGQSSLAASSGLTSTLNRVGPTVQILTAVTEIGRVAAGIIVAGGLVVKVVKEKVQSATENRERRSYEIHWNK